MPRPSGGDTLPSFIVRSLARHAAPAASVLLLLASSSLPAQTDQAPQNDHPYTLHVYERLVQLPTLVLSDSHEPLPPIDRESFNLSLDSGPRFHPTRVRLEGDDPISLAIFLDESGTQHDELPTLATAFPSWIAQSLKPGDSVTLYAGDCTMVRSIKSLPPNNTLLQAHLTAALQAQQIHRTAKHSNCNTFMPLRDFLSFIMRDLSSAPGRRVILAITSGWDESSRITPEQLRLTVANSAVTVFGLGISRPFTDGPPATFNALCEESGGLYLTTSPRRTPQDLAKVIDLVRGRYVLEFPTPFNNSSGSHRIEVSIRHKAAFIRPSAVTVPIPDHTIAEDPNTVPTDTSNQPHIGDHRPPQPR